MPPKTFVVLLKFVPKLLLELKVLVLARFTTPVAPSVMAPEEALKVVAPDMMTLPLMIMSLFTERIVPPAPVTLPTLIAVFSEYVNVPEPVLAFNWPKRPVAPLGLAAAALKTTFAPVALPATVLMVVVPKMNCVEKLSS